VTIGKGWIATETGFMGRFPVRTEITVIPADEYETCSLCRRDVRWLAVHCREVGDADHLALEVMET
jgi:hypothetical protein